MDQLLLLLSPVAVWFVVGGVKKFRNWASVSVSKPVMRVVVGVISIAAVVSKSILAGEPIEVTQLNELSQGLLEAVVVFLAASGAHFLSKKKKVAAEPPLDDE